ncbi:MAG TPA: YwiC-like family protein, partial [Arenimonas sp.]|nr:YwiC-like family protein [Arenimonas sp.]
TELAWNATYLGALILGIPEWGLVSAGVGFWFAYLIYYLVMVWVATRLIGHKPERRNWVLMLLLLLAGGLIVYVAAQPAEMGFWIGLLATLVVGVFSLRRLEDLINVRDWLQKKWAKIYFDSIK